jgi:predicted anti-sigma-YlaC factor YlaD
MTCREFIEFLLEYLLGTVDRERFDAHLAECDSCVSYLKTYQEAVRMGRIALSEGEDLLPEEPPEDLVRAILASRGKRS